MPTPRGGGIAVVIVFYGGLFYLFSNYKVEDNLIFALIAGLPVAAIGLIDDILNLKPIVRLSIQSISTIIALIFLKGLQDFHLITFILHMPVLFTLIGFIAVIWSINLFNFMDGIDGYLGSEVIFLGLSVYILTKDSIGLLIVFSSLGFLFWNWQKARIFMGDVGSSFIGFIFGIIAIYQQNSCKLSIIVWLILASVFWFDASITLFRRLRNREKIYIAHRKHAYQRLIQAGFSHQKTVVFSILLNVIVFILAFLANRYKSLEWIFFFVDIIMLYLILKWVDKLNPFQYSFNKELN